MASKSDIYKQSVEITYEWIDDHFDELYENCTDEDDRKYLRQLHSSARDAFWAAQSRNLSDSNAVVEKIADDLKKVTKEIKKMEADLKNIVQIFKLVTEAVKLAGALVTLAAA